jgi:hypothetical protein
MKKRVQSPLSIRPYQVLCLICGSVSEPEEGPRRRGARRLLNAIRKDPDRPIRLVCNAGAIFAYQDPGIDDDTPEGPDYNIKRDLDILRRLNLMPGAMVPARILLGLIFNLIPANERICASPGAPSPAWRGCPRAATGHYVEGIQAGIHALIPSRPDDLMQSEKRASLIQMEKGEGIRIRPHILMCAVCQYGNGVRPPYPEDNLPEFLELILTRTPDLPVTLVRGADWDMCASCPSRVPAFNACVHGRFGAGGLYNEMKDLTVLQVLGLTYETTMKARDLFRLIFEKIPRGYGVCALPAEGLPETSVWYDICARTEGPYGYEKGRELLQKRLK